MECGVAVLLFLALIAEEFLSGCRVDGNAVRHSKHATNYDVTIRRDRSSLALHRHLIASSKLRHDVDVASEDLNTQSHSSSRYRRSNLLQLDPFATPSTIRSNAKNRQQGETEFAADVNLVHSAVNRTSAEKYYRDSALHVRQDATSNIGVDDAGLAKVDHFDLENRTLKVDQLSSTSATARSKRRKIPEYVGYGRNELTKQATTVNSDVTDEELGGNATIFSSPVGGISSSRRISDETENDETESRYLSKSATKKPKEAEVGEKSRSRVFVNNVGKFAVGADSTDVGDFGPSVDGLFRAAPETDVRQDNIKALPLTGDDDSGEWTAANADDREWDEACAQLNCMASAECVPDTLRDGRPRCRCPLGTGGRRCQQDLSVRYPRFLGEGFMTFPALGGDTFREFSAFIEFRPETNNGLLLFSADRPDAKYDFFSVALFDGKTDFRFDCGSGAGRVTTTNSILLGQWNTIEIHRNEQAGYVRLNDGPLAKGWSKGLFNKVTSRIGLYLGGYDNGSLIGQRTGMPWGYVGCIKRLVVNGRPYDMRQGAFVGDALRGYDVYECSEHVCDEIRCYNGGTCTAVGPDTSLCLCPLGFAGDRCQFQVDVVVPYFDGHSWLQFSGLRRTVLTFTEIDVIFKPDGADGLLLYNGYATDRSGDFISLALRDAYVEYRFNLGTGAAVIRSPRRVSMNEWHTARLTRTGRQGTLTVDGGSKMEGISLGPFTQLTLNLDLFIGGHRNFDETARSADVDRSFTGCIQQVVINERPLKLIEEALNGVSVSNCNQTCVNRPCQNGGQCVPMKDNYRCVCPTGFNNVNCTEKTARYRYRYRYRRQSEFMMPISIPMFDGQSYILYRAGEVTSRLQFNNSGCVECTLISLRMRTNHSQGVLFWVGPESRDVQGTNQSQTDDKTSLTVSLVDGRVSFQVSQLAVEHEINLLSRTRVNDNLWHVVAVNRRNGSVCLVIDGRIQKSTGCSRHTSLFQTTSHHVAVLGAMPAARHVHDEKKLHSTASSPVGDLHNRNDGRNGFVGCIAAMTVDGDYHVGLVGESSDISNVDNCWTEFDLDPTLRIV